MAKKFTVASVHSWVLKGGGFKGGGRYLGNLKGSLGALGSGGEHLGNLGLQKSLEPPPPQNLKNPIGSTDQAAADRA